MRPAKKPAGAFDILRTNPVSACCAIVFTGFVLGLLAAHHSRSAADPLFVRACRPLTDERGAAHRPVFTVSNGSDTAPGCTRTPVRYFPSAWEAEWASSIKKLQSDEPKWDAGCEKMLKDREHVLNMFMAFDTHMRATCEMNGDDVELDPRVFSMLQVEETCEGSDGERARVSVHNRSIEPLVGFLRDPRALCGFGDERAAQDTIGSKEWLLLAQPPCEGARAGGRHILLALGAPIYNDAQGLASQKWVTEAYRQRGLVFDEVHIWDERIPDFYEFWRQYPPYLRPVTRLYAVAANAEPNSLDNPLRTLSAIATPADFVVLKIDSHSPGMEEQLVQQILNAPGYAELIDEMFWEHTARGNPMQYHGWGVVSEKTSRTLADTYVMLAALREKGIRAHSWA